MCGRFNLVVPNLDELRRYLPIEENHIELWTPRYNIAPSQLAPVLHLTDEGSTRLSLMSWGLQRHGTTEPSRAPPINARVETLRQRPTFRDLVGRRQCIVPATGYYEWLARSGRKQPWHIAPPSGVLAMAGLWDRWTSKAGDVIETFAVITADAAPQIASIHDRMPLLIEPLEARAWLAGSRPPADPWTRVATTLTAVPISTRVSSPAHDDPSVLEPARETVEPQLSLSLTPEPRPGTSRHKR